MFITHLSPSTATTQKVLTSTHDHITFAIVPLYSRGAGTCLQCKSTFLLMRRRTAVSPEHIIWTLMPHIQGNISFPEHTVVSRVMVRDLILAFGYHVLTRWHCSIKQSFQNSLECDKTIICFQLWVQQTKDDAYEFERFKGAIEIIDLYCTCGLLMLMAQFRIPDGTGASFEKATKVRLMRDK